MKKVYITLVLLILFTQFVEAQLVLPTTAQKPVWEVIQNQLHSELYYELVIQVEKDTVLCGEKYSKVIATYKSNNSDTLVFGFYRQEDSKVFFRLFNEPCNIFDEYLIYDFTLEVGDTIAVGWKQMAVVTAIQDFRLGNVERRAIGVQYYQQEFVLPIAEEWWIEGIGGSKYPFLQSFCSLYSCYESSNLLCMRAMDKVLFTVGNENCQYDTLTTSTDNNVNSFIQAFQLSPNPLPTGSKIKINYHLKQPSHVNIAIVTIFGRVLHQEQVDKVNVENNITLSWLPAISGIYWLVWQGEHGEWQAVSFIVQ